MQRIRFFVVFIGEGQKTQGGIEMDDDMLLALYWGRSESAIRETDKKYGGYCFSIAINILQSHEDAEECVNDTYRIAWDTIPPQRPANFRAYLGKITRNLSLNKYKEQRRKKRGGDNMALIYSELEECIQPVMWRKNTKPAWSSGPSTPFCCPWIAKAGSCS